MRKEHLVSSYTGASPHPSGWGLFAFIGACGASQGDKATLPNPAPRASSSHEAVPFLTPIVTTVPTSEDLCNCLSSDTDIYLSLTVVTDSRIPIREDAVTANASVGRHQTLLFVANDLLVPP